MIKHSTAQSSFGQNGGYLVVFSTVLRIRDAVIILDTRLTLSQTVTVVAVTAALWKR